MFNRFAVPGRLLLFLALLAISLLFLLTGDTIVGRNLLLATASTYAIILAHKSDRGDPQSLV